MAVGLGGCRIKAENKAEAQHSWGLGLAQLGNRVKWGCRVIAGWGVVV